MNEHTEKKFRLAIDSTLESEDLRYIGELKNMDYFSLFCKATAKDKLYKFLGLNVCMFNYTFERQDALMIIFSIPNGDESSTKDVADKVMDIVELAEHLFITLDHVDSTEIKDDKFIYTTIVKKINNAN